MRTIGVRRRFAIGCPQILPPCESVAASSGERMASETDERRVTAWIGQGVAAGGRITSAQDLRMDGKVEGTIEVADHGPVIGASAEGKAHLVARPMVISGTVTG